jgi:hypothetical protein
MTLPRPLPWLGLALFFLAGVVGCGSLEDERPAKWSFIYSTIIQPQCATVNCHSAIAKKGNVDVHDRDIAYCALGASFIPYLVADTSDAIPRMPPDSPLPAADIELISRWAAADGMNDKKPSDFCYTLTP